MTSPQRSASSGWSVSSLRSSRWRSSRVAHPDGTGLHPILDVPAKKGAFFSYSFSPDGTQMTIGALPGCGPEGMADVYIGRFDAQERVGFRNSANPLWLGGFETRAFGSPANQERTETDG